MIVDLFARRRYSQPDARNGLVYSPLLVDLSAPVRALPSDQTLGGSLPSLVQPKSLSWCCFGEGYQSDRVGSPALIWVRRRDYLCVRRY